MGMEASPDLLPDGGALMWARVSLVSPAWLGLRWCQDAGAFRATSDPGCDGRPLPRSEDLGPGSGIFIEHKVTRV